MSIKTVTLNDVAKHSAYTFVSIGENLYHIGKNKNLIHVCIPKTTYNQGESLLVETLSKTNGKIDGVLLPFKEYFHWANRPPYLQENRWDGSVGRGSGNPTEEDYRRIADVLDQYIRIFCE